MKTAIFENITEPEPELIERLFDAWKWKPDAISIEYDEDPVIQVEWLFENKLKRYGFTPIRWDALWRIFHEYWNEYGGTETIDEEVKDV